MTTIYNLQKQWFGDWYPIQDFYTLEEADTKLEQVKGQVPFRVVRIDMDTLAKEIVTVTHQGKV